MTLGSAPISIPLQNGAKGAARVEIKDKRMVGKEIHPTQSITIESISVICKKEGWSMKMYIDYR